jgi:BirA family biotin operon repressor/biotin-[acetyl-CoA-carboxylase] ligase
MPEYDAAGIADGLEAPYDVEYHERIGSTNDRGRELAREGRSGIVVVADEQTGGRGRKDRTWSGPPGGIYCSIVLDPYLDPDDVPMLTLGAAVATARAAREAGVPAGIKWPNDVVVPVGDGKPVDADRHTGTVREGDLEERKLAGILTERAAGRVVVGIGVNANVDAERLPAGATTMRELVGAIGRRVFLQCLLEEFHDLAADPAAILPAWRELATTLGRRVRVDTPAGEVIGVARDVERPGRLVVETTDGLRRVTTGDCEHLRPV